MAHCKLTTEQRLTAVRQFLAGRHQTEIARDLKVDQSTISRALKHTRERWQAQYLANFDAALAEVLARLADVARRASEIGDLSLLHQVLKTQSQTILGRLPQRVELSGSAVPWSEIANRAIETSSADPVGDRLRGYEQEGPPNGNGRV